MPRCVTDQDELEKSILCRVWGEDLPVILDEPNVLVLDTAEWRLDGGQWNDAEELLRLDGKARKLMGMPEKTGRIVQPWVKSPSPRSHGRLELRFRIHCACAVPQAELAVEQPEGASFALDGSELEFRDAGWWTDECIRKTPLPMLAEGDHELCIARDYHDDTDIEQAFILGDFGVDVSGRKCSVTAPVRTLHWGNAVCQGLPFYGGNITYHASFEMDRAAEAALRFQSRQAGIGRELNGPEVAKEVDFAAFHGTLASVAIDGREAGDIAFSPFQLALGRLEAGRHSIDITLYGSRINCFGALHRAWRMRWAGPVAWRTQGDDFAYEYSIQPLGVMKSPLVIDAGPRP